MAAGFGHNRRTKNTSEPRILPVDLLTIDRMNRWDRRQCLLEVISGSPAARALPVELEKCRDSQENFQSTLLSHREITS